MEQRKAVHLWFNHSEGCKTRWKQPFESLRGDTSFRFFVIEIREKPVSQFVIPNRGRQQNTALIDRRDKSKLLSDTTEMVEWRKNIWTTLKNNVEHDLRWISPWMQTSTEAMNILCHIEIVRVQLHTSQILIVLRLFLILLCCLLQRVSDLDAVHLPGNSYLLITVTYSLIIQLRWLRQKCLSHHFSGCGDQYRHRCQGDGAGLTVASLWQQTCFQTTIFWVSHQLQYFWFFTRVLYSPLELFRKLEQVLC